MRTPEKENGFALRLAKAGDQVRIVALSGGKGCQDRLAGMGLRIGGEVQVLRNDKGKKLLLGYQGNRLFLGGGMAHKIKVAVIKGESK
jgi:Fe2+ transport system protein FeoA